MRQALVAVLALAACGYSTLAFGDEDERMALARQIIAMRSDAAEMQYFDASLPFYMNAMEETLNVTDRERERLPDMLREEYRAALGPARERSAATYARIFDETEITQILDFYESDAGRKFLARQTELQQDGIDLQRLINAAVLQRAAERLLGARERHDF